jgi:tetratricopeptide (TPR) repeat protein
MVRLGERDKTDQPKGAWYPVECYFERAIRFIPDDLLVRVIYANYLIKQGLHKEAAVQVDIADKAGDDQTANFYYNLGLALFDLKQYDRAVVRAKQAYDLGFPLPGLKDKLAKVGKWEP